MRELGKYLAIIGLGSFAIGAFGLEFKLLMWIDAWGPLVGNSIRVALIVIGASMFFLGSNSEEETENFDDIAVPAE